MSNENQKVSADQIAKIRTLDDFDLVMLISEIHDHGWPTAAQTLEHIIAAQRAAKAKGN